jgi:hypothetical protein
LTTDRVHSYIVSGFRVTSNVAFPQMHKVDAVESADIRIEVRFSGNRDWLEPVPGVVRPYVKLLSKESVVLEHPFHGELTISADRIGVEVADAIHWEEARTYVLGTALAISTFMRGAVPFHMSSVQVGSKAFAFAGESHAGKSTWAALTLIEFDAILLTDDVARVSGDILAKRATIWPSLRRLRFRDDLGPVLQANGLHQVERDPQGRLECYDFRSRCSPCELQTVFLPVPCAEKGVVLRRVAPEQRLAAIYDNIFRPEYGFAILGPSAVMKSVLEFASSVQIYELRYPPGMEHAMRNVAEFRQELTRIGCI